jgi:subtilase family serine protease
VPTPNTSRGSTTSTTSTAGRSSTGTTGTTGTQAGAGTADPTGYTPAQIRHACGFDQISFPGGVVGDGSGATIAVVDAYDDPNIASDLHQFDLQFGLPDPSFTKVNQTGGSTLPAAESRWASEIALDVEWAHAIAPGASILLVEANDSSYSNLLAAVDYARRQPGVAVVSMSWGAAFSSETFDDSLFQAPRDHAGVVFVVAAGDDGALFPTRPPRPMC